MANPCLELLGTLCSIVGLILTIVACSLPEWQVNDVEGEVIESIKRTTGLWSSCTFYNTGNWQCDQYDTFFLGLPATVQLARAAVCIALTCQGLAMVAGLGGLDCTNIIPSYEGAPNEEQNGALKQKIMIAVAILNIIAGIFLCVGVSYYASEVLSDYNDMSQILQMKGGQRIGRSISGDRYVYGQCLFLGWAAMIIDLAAGGIILCGSCGESNMVGVEGSFMGTNRRLVPQNNFAAELASQPNFHQEYKRGNGGQDYV